MHDCVAIDAARMEHAINNETFSDKSSISSIHIINKIEDGVSSLESSSIKDDEND